VPHELHGSVERRGGDGESDQRGDIHRERWKRRGLVVVEGQDERELSSLLTRLIYVCQVGEADRQRSDFEI
jgi:hypothetical protein